MDKKNHEIKQLKEGEVEAETLAKQLKTLNDQLKRMSGENEGLYR